MKKNKNKPGCDFGGFLQTVSPLLGLIPGAGAILAPTAAMVGGMMSQANQQAPQPMMPRQQNTNPYGMAMGGQISPGPSSRAKEAIQYQLDYLQSANYKRRIKQAQNSKEYPMSPFFNSADVMADLSFGTVKEGSTAGKGSGYVPSTRTTYIDPKSADNKNTFPQEDLYDHEISHIGTMGSTIPYNYNNLIKRMKTPPSSYLNTTLNTLNKGNDTLTNNNRVEILKQVAKREGHDKSPEELRADIQAIRMDMKRRGIYDDLAPKAGMITKEHLDKYKNIDVYKEDKWQKETIKSNNFDALKSNYDESNMLWLLNNIVGNSDKNLNKQYAATGGYLNQTGPNTQEVVGNNPSQTDGVELPQAYVDHGETISNTPQGKYVFSDILTNPLTGNSFAEDDKKLAMSDKKASAKPYDKEAMNTLKINEKMRSQLAQVNDITRGLSDLNTQMKGMAKGGYMKPSYGKGGPKQPWDNFDYNSFYDFVGRDAMTAGGFNMDSQWGPAHQKLWDTVGPNYQQHIGYDNASKQYRIPDAALAPGIEGVSVPDYSTGEITDVSKFTGPQTDPLTGLTSQVDQYSAKTTGIVPPYVEEPKDINKLFPNGIPFQHQRTGPNEVTNSATGVVTRDFPSIPNAAGADNLTPGPGTDNRTWLDKNAGTALQGLGFLARAATIAKRPDKQNLYLNNAPITPQSYDPSQALNRSQYAFNALKANIGNSVGDGARMANLQQGYANQGMNQAQIVNQYDQMNKQAQVNYEQRLGQRQAENNQTRYAVDQVDDQNLGARNNAARALFTDASSLGSEINNQKSNQQSVQWLLSAFPELMKLPEFQNIIGKGKTKKGGYYGRV